MEFPLRVKAKNHSLEIYDSDNTLVFETDFVMIGRREIQKIIRDIKEIVKLANIGYENGQDVQEVSTTLSKKTKRKKESKN